ncbi:hypothetical protein PCE1_001446 [Barthelona sp. PCE]
MPEVFLRIFEEHGASAMLYQELSKYIHKCLISVDNDDDDTYTRYNQCLMALVGQSDSFRKPLRTNFVSAIVGTLHLFNIEYVELIFESFLRLLFLPDTKKRVFCISIIKEVFLSNFFAKFPVDTQLFDELNAAMVSLLNDKLQTIRLLAVETCTHLVVSVEVINSLLSLIVHDGSNEKICKAAFKSLKEIFIDPQLLIESEELHIKIISVFITLLDNKAVRSDIIPVLVDLLSNVDIPAQEILWIIRSLMNLNEESDRELVKDQLSIWISHHISDDIVLSIIDKIELERLSKADIDILTEFLKIVAMESTSFLPENIYVFVKENENIIAEMPDRQQEVNEIAKNMNIKREKLLSTIRDNCYGFLTDIRSVYLLSAVCSCFTDQQFTALTPSPFVFSELLFVSTKFVKESHFSFLINSLSAILSEVNKRGVFAEDEYHRSIIIENLLRPLSRDFVDWDMRDTVSDDILDKLFCNLITTARSVDFVDVIRGDLQFMYHYSTHLQICINEAREREQEITQAFLEIPLISNDDMYYFMRTCNNLSSIGYLSSGLQNACLKVFITFIESRGGFVTDRHPFTQFILNYSPDEELKCLLFRTVLDLLLSKGIYFIETCVETFGLTDIFSYTSPQNESEDESEEEDSVLLTEIEHSLTSLLWNCVDSNELHEEYTTEMFKGFCLLIANIQLPWFDKLGVTADDVEIFSQAFNMEEILSCILFYWLINPNDIVIQQQGAMLLNVAFAPYTLQIMNALPLFLTGVLSDSGDPTPILRIVFDLLSNLKTVDGSFYEWILLLIAILVRSLYCDDDSDRIVMGRSILNDMSEYYAYFDSIRAKEDLNPMRQGILYCCNGLIAEILDEQSNKAKNKQFLVSTKKNLKTFTDSIEPLINGFTFSDCERLRGIYDYMNLLFNIDNYG